MKIILSTEKIARFLIAVVLIVCPAAAAMRAAAGGSDEGNAVAAQSDGKIIVAGKSQVGAEYYFSLVRYNASGSLDAAFGINGKVLTRVGYHGGANAVAVLPDGKILAAGFSKEFAGSPGKFALVRYNSNGSLDQTFGIVLTAFTEIFQPLDSGALAMGVTSSGKIVLAGFAGDQAAIARYNPNGSLDTTFDTDGKKTIAGTRSAKIEALLIDGVKIVVAVNDEYYNGGSPYARIIRLNSGGSSDTTFGNGGTVTTSLDVITGLSPLITQAGEDRLLASGYRIPLLGGNITILMSYSFYNGAVDTTFGSGGSVNTNLFQGGKNYVKVQKQFGTANGIIVAGTAANLSGNGSAFTVKRFSIYGAPDNSFGSGGIAQPNFGYPSFCKALLVQTDGKIVAAGDTGGDFAAARLTFNGSLDTAFDADGKRTDNIGNP